jgi:S1-C subfamily serine protease
MEQPMSRFVNAAARGLWGLALAAALAAPAAVRADANIYRQALPATALVLQPVTKVQTSIGTGTLIDADRRLLITAEHVVGANDAAAVFFPQSGGDGDPITDASFYLKNADKYGIHGRVVARNRAADVALLQLDRVPAKARTVPLATARPHPGENLHVIGSSGFNDNVLWRYTHGNVRDVYQKQWNAENGPHSGRVIEMEAPINHGDSGGPVLNDKGELIGVVSNVNEKLHDMEYAIEVSEVVALLDGLDKAPAVPPALPPSVGGKKKPTPAAPGLAGTAWASTDADENGERLVLDFRPDGTLVLGVADADGTVTKKLTARYAQAGDSLTVRDVGGADVLRLRLDAQGRLHLTGADGAETVWVRVKLV